MKRFFYVGIVALICFEIANVYLIMPMPGSQRMRSIDLAYALYTWRWAIRGASLLLVAAGLWWAWRSAGRARWLVPLLLMLAAGVAYATNVRMAADQMFRAPTRLRMEPASRNTVDSLRLVVGVAIGEDARAYPVRYIGYHHQVRDTIAGRPVLVSYCTVCRTGRVFSPIVDGRAESFRLVGMDHFNAMFEDASTGSWWRQANGEAIVGARRGTTLTEIPSQQVTLGRWLTMHPQSLVMQADSASLAKYTKTYEYENGTSTSALTGTDTVSWHDKAWVIGMTVNGASKAFDWRRLRHERVVNDVVGDTPIVLALARDGVNFFAFTRPDAATRFALRGDSLVTATSSYGLDGHGATGTLTPVLASQEFWHSWRTFHPGTASY
jgi:hypothetical protein